jgi:hypothetical protein
MVHFSSNFHAIAEGRKASPSLEWVSERGGLLAARMQLPYRVSYEPRMAEYAATGNILLKPVMILI